MAKPKQPVRYHLTKKGEPGRCKAKKRECPRKLTGHYKTYAEAQIEADKQHLSQQVASTPTTRSRELLPRILAQPRRWHAIQSQLLLPTSGKTVSSVVAYWRAYQHAIKQNCPQDRDDLETYLNMDDSHPSIQAGLDTANWVIQHPTHWQTVKRTVVARNQYGELLHDITRQLTEGRYPHNPFKKNQQVLLDNGEIIQVTSARQGSTSENERKNTISFKPPVIIWKDDTGNRREAQVTLKMLVRNQQGVYLHRDLAAEQILDSPQEVPGRPSTYRG